MSAIKRSPSFSEESDSEYDSKPVVSKKSSTSPKKVSASPSKKRKPTPWTPEEDMFLIEAAEKLLKSNLWKAVQDDPRMKTRGSTGVDVHMRVLMNKIKGGKGK